MVRSLIQKHWNDSKTLWPGHISIVKILLECCLKKNYKNAIKKISNRKINTEKRLYVKCKGYDI